MVSESCFIIFIINDKYSLFFENIKQIWEKNSVGMGFDYFEPF